MSGDNGASVGDYVFGQTERQRRQHQLHMRAAMGVTSGISSYWTPLGMMTGTGGSGSSSPPVNPDQFGDQTDQGADNGGMGDSSGGSDAGAGSGGTT